MLERGVEDVLGEAVALGGVVATVLGGGMGVMRWTLGRLVVRGEEVGLLVGVVAGLSPAEVV